MREHLDLENILAVVDDSSQTSAILEGSYWSRFLHSRLSGSALGLFAVFRMRPHMSFFDEGMSSSSSDKGAPFPKPERALSWLSYITLVLLKGQTIAQFFDEYCDI